MKPSPAEPPKCCPFCGARASVMDGAMIVGGIGDHWCICTSAPRCSATGPTRKTPAGAVRAWNAIPRPMLDGKVVGWIQVAHRRKAGTL